MVRVRTRPKCHEGNWRELTSDSNINCGIAREREKINLSEHTAGHSQNKGTEQFQRRASQMRTSPSPARGRREGKGANSAPVMASLTKLQTGSQFLTKDFLRFWMVDIHQEGRS